MRGSGSTGSGRGRGSRFYPTAVSLRGSGLPTSLVAGDGLSIPMAIASRGSGRVERPKASGSTRTDRGQSTKVSGHRTDRRGRGSRSGRMVVGMRVSTWRG